MSSLSSLIPKLIRAANQAATLEAFDRCRLLQEAIVTVRGLRETFHILEAAGAIDTIIQLQVLLAEIGALANTPYEIKQCLLLAAAMLRDLNVILDQGHDQHNAMGHKPSVDARS